MNIAPDAQLEFRLFPALRRRFPLGVDGLQDGRAERNGNVVGGVNGEPALEVEPAVDLGPIYFLAIFVHQHGLDHLFGLLLAFVGVRRHQPREQLFFDIVSSTGDKDGDGAVPDNMHGLGTALGAVTTT